MGIITSKDLGGVTYITISEPYPMFSATTNYVAINPSGRMFVNIPNTSQWFPLDKSRYAEMQTWDNATSTSYTSANNGVYAFFGSALFSPTATTLNGFTRVTTPGATALALSANTDNIGRYLSTGVIGMYVTSAAAYDQMPYEIIPSLNNSTVISVINSSTGATWGANTDCAPDIANGEVTIFANRVMDVDGNVGDFTKIAARVYNDGLTAYGTYGTRHYKLTNKLIEEPTMLYFRNFESGQPRNLTFANDTTNKWIIGSATTYNGVYSLYVSSGSSASSSNLYNTGAASISHAWVDLAFPVGNQNVGNTPYYVSFRWRCSGSTNDYCNIYLTPTGLTPTAGSSIASNYLLAGPYNNVTGYTTSKIVFSGLSISSTTTNSTVFSETWETGSITGDTGGWTVANGATNKWTVGSATTSGGTYSAYITTGATGTTTALNAYDVNTAQVSHLYRDITFPSSANSITLKFNWRAQGENASVATQYDYGAVVITTTATTPTAGTEVSTTQATAGGNGRIGATANLGKFNLNYIAGGNWNTETIDMTAYSGQTKRIVFTWVNDTSLGTQPPFAIDNIVISSTTTTTQGYGTKNEDGYITNRLVFSWINTGGAGVQPPMAIDNLAVYCYPAVPNS